MGNFDVNFDVNFDFILNEIDKLYNDYEIEYNSYIKTRQIVRYKPINITLLTSIYCYTTLFNFFFIK